jgi:phosphatidylglycerol lysyltransferase
MQSRRLKWLTPVVVACLFAAVLVLLHRELHQYQLRDILAAVHAIPHGRLLLACLLTALDYVLLTGYDGLALAHLGQRLRVGRVALASFLGYGIGHNLGMLLGGSTIRYRLYSSWGLSAFQVLGLVVFLGVTFWLGVLTLGSAVFLIDPFSVPARLGLPFANTRWLGLVMLPIGAAYLLLAGLRHRPLKIGQQEFTLPRLPIALGQCLVSACDLALAAGVLYALLPASAQGGYVRFLGIYLLSVVAAVITQVPGGLGVLELAVLTLLQPTEPHSVMGALLAYRVIYYLLPLLLAIGLFGVHEFAGLRQRTRAVIGRFGLWGPGVVAPALAVGVMFAGAVLLLSGATPTVDSRLGLLLRFLPLPTIEASHLLGSVVGILLLILARGLLRRLDSAYVMTLILLTVGILLSLLKGLDYEEALLLSLVLAILLPCRPHFYRRGALNADQASAYWLVPVVMILVSCAWLMLFAYRHTEYAGELWWRFAVDGHAPRSLRAMVAAAVCLLAFGVSRVLRPRPRVPGLPGPADLEAARCVVQANPQTAAYLALLGDKHFLFNDERTAFIMYGIEGRSWVSMGDPVGPASAALELAWNFRELSDREGAYPVFYEVCDARLGMYIDMGLTLVKIGEEARVDLTAFNLDGGDRRALRRVHHHLGEKGFRLEIIPVEKVPEVMESLRAVSDAWREGKRGAEKGFSLGFFKEDYLALTPVAVVRHGQDIVAFANLWCSGDREELSADLMRYGANAPANVMEYLFVSLMLWGREAGYRWFSLGMAPLAGVEAHPFMPLWNKMAALAYRHGEGFYNFQGLRRYKDKFKPVWEPRYLASPGGLALPVVVANLTTLIGGGVKGVLRR